MVSHRLHFLIIFLVGTAASALPDQCCSQLSHCRSKPSAKPVSTAWCSLPWKTSLVFKNKDKFELPGTVSCRAPACLAEYLGPQLLKKCDLRSYRYLWDQVCEQWPGSGEAPGRVSLVLLRQEAEGTRACSHAGLTHMGSGLDSLRSSRKLLRSFPQTRAWRLWPFSAFSQRCSSNDATR